MTLNPFVMFFIGLLCSLPIIMWAFMTIESKVSDRTTKLEIKMDEIRKARSRKTAKILELEEQLSKLSLENDRLNLKYQRLLSETENIFNDN